MPLRIGFCDQSQLFFGAGQCQFESVTHYSRNAISGKNGNVDSDLLGEFGVNPSSCSRVFSLGVFPYNELVQFCRSDVFQRTLDSRKES